MSEFDTIDQNSVAETSRRLQASTTCLDSIPSDFFFPKTIVKSELSDRK